MPTTTITFRLTDGTTTCDFSSASTTFALRMPGWQPAVAQLRDNDMGGQTAYADCDEVIPLDVLGTTAALAQANLRALEALLAQATRFDRGFAVNPVRLEVQVQGSDLATPLHARVRGGRIDRVGAEYTEGTLYAPAGIPIDLTVTRTGLWYSSTEESSGTATGFRAYDKAGLTFGTSLSGTDHPIRLTIDGLTTANGDWYPGYIVVAPSGNHIGIFEAETIFTTGTTIGAADESRGSTRRFTTSTSGSSFAADAAVNTSSVVHVFASINRSSGNWTTWTRATLAGGSAIDGPILTVAPHANAYFVTDPIVLAYPPILLPSPATSFEVFFQVDGAGGTMNCDYVALAGDAQVVKLFSPQGYGTTSPSLELTPRPIDGIRPSIRVLNSGALNKTVSYEGDAYLTSKHATTIGIGWFQNERHLTAPSWAITNGSGTAKTHTIQAHRRRAYVIPE